MIKKIAEFCFDTAKGRASVWIGAVLALVACWQIDRAHVRAKGASNAASDLNVEAGKLAAKARAARGGAFSGDPLRRLRDHENCRDC